MPFGFWSVWDPISYWHVPLAQVSSSLPFGFWSVWDLARLHAYATETITSSLPFGFWSVWDELEIILARLHAGGLHCLSAFGLFGTTCHSSTCLCSASVFIAFRLLVCLGPGPTVCQQKAHPQSSLPFGFWSVWDMTELEISLSRLHACLHCLSAFGLFGTRGHASAYAEVIMSSLPFGFWSVWDCTLVQPRPSRARAGLHCLSAFGLFGTRTSAPARMKASSLHCLSAFGLFGTTRRQSNIGTCHSSLHCLSAFGLFGTEWEDDEAGEYFRCLHCLSAFGLFGTPRPG